MGAKVTVTSVGKGLSTETTTNESGNYTVTHLIPDAYRVKFEAAGFKSYDVPSVQVSADAAVRLDPQLQVGAVTQTVEVTGEVPQLKTDRADVAIEFNERYVEDLPILNRNFTNFELLSPGTQKLVGWSHAATENPQGGQQFSSMASTSAARPLSWMGQTTKIQFSESSWSIRTSTPSKNPRSHYKIMTPSSARLSRVL